MSAVMFCSGLFIGLVVGAAVAILLNDKIEDWHRGLK